MDGPSPRAPISRLGPKRPALRRRSEQSCSNWPRPWPTRCGVGRLLSLETLPNVRLGVIPFDREAPALYLNGFTLFDVPDEPSVLVETLGHELLLSDPDQLTTYRETFGRLLDAAATGERAHALV